ncbi:ImmA/IrrE family metallo-endopeptidase [Shewanella carassii]|uniref:ImmA/IrrE family metallo-endopeptidase n=1 Tax=Shewanella carassii TaxID=1987584 RepID=UPI001C8049D6|nr:ImmA/IrrE family metallo-endopeptidase [Shewanella carassii]
MDDFNPDWVSPPGDTIVGLLDEFGFSVEELGRRIGLPRNKTDKLISGDVSIEDHIAYRLESTFNVPSQFWLSRDEIYQNFKMKSLEREKRWLDSLPISDMVKYGWIPRINKGDNRVVDCLKFFNVSSINEWEDDFKNSLPVAFRKSLTFKTDPVSVYTWLNQAKHLSNSIRCYPWDRDMLLESIPSIRALTTEPEPSIFLPKLEKIFADSGVAFVVVRTPSGCRASGATCFFEIEKPTIVMSFRYRTDDHFWFTLFHEIAHLILHSTNKEIFIEDSSVSDCDSLEIEANEFASNVLIPNEYRSELLKLKKSDWKKIVRLAKKIGVSKGIVLGQLQHVGNIDHAYLNRLKVRYTWSND